MKKGNIVKKVKEKKNDKESKKCRIESKKKSLFVFAFFRTWNSKSVCKESFLIASEKMALT